MLRRQILDKGSVLELNPYVKGEGESGYDVIDQPTIFKILECKSEKGGSSLVYRAKDIFGKTVLLKEFYPVFMDIKRDEKGHLIVADGETEEYKLRRESFLRGLELQNKLRENGERVRGDIILLDFIREKDPKRCVNRFISIDGVYVDTRSKTPEGNEPVLYAVMPEYRGIDFEELYDNNISLEIFLKALISLNEALYSIEQLGYYYIDIKPDNFSVALFDNDTLAVTLFDFDSIVPVKDDKQNVSVTYSEEWGAPELEAHEISKKSMVFSVGVMLFRKLFGKMPGIDDTDIRLGRWSFDELDPKLTAYCNLKIHEQKIEQDISFDPITGIKATERLEKKSTSEVYIKESHSELQRVFYLIRRCLVKSLAYDQRLRTDLSGLTQLLNKLMETLAPANIAIARQAEAFSELCRHHDKEMNSMAIIFSDSFIADLSRFNERKGDGFHYEFYYSGKNYDQVKELADAKKEVDRGEPQITQSTVETAITDKVICAFEFMYYQFQYEEGNAPHKVAPHWCYNKNYSLNPGALRLRKMYPVLYADLLTAAAKVYLDRGRTDGIYNDPMDALELLREARTIYDKHLFYNRFIAVRSDEDRLKEAECDMRICEAIMKISRSCNNDTKTVLTKNMWFESVEECAEDILAYAFEALNLFPHTKDALELRDTLKDECREFFDEIGDTDKAYKFK